jgi:tetratricopeptide (TPR) repeat protein
MPSCPDAGQLAAYVDGVLDDRARHDIQAHLVTCKDCRDSVAETVRVIALTQPHARRLRWPNRWMAGFAVAAALLVAIYLFHPERWFGAPRERQDMEALIAAVATEPTRPVEGLLTGGFPYAPPPSFERGVLRRQPSAAVLSAADRLVTNAGPSSGNHAVGLAHLVIGEFDRAIDALERAGRGRPADAAVQSDLSAAYLLRARTLNRPDDWSRALISADRAAALAPRMVEAQFNRGLALEGLHRDVEAAEAFAKFRTVAGSPAAESEAASRERTARERTRRSS